MYRGGGVQQESKLAYGVRNVFEDQLSRGFFPTVRATAVGRDAERNAEWDAVLAGDPKMFRLLCNTNLNMNIPSRGSEEERIRIPCGYGLINRVTDIINKTEIGKYVSGVRYQVTWHTSAALAEGRLEAMAGWER